MSVHLDYLLNLPGVRVEVCKEVDGIMSLQLEMRSIGMNCPYCQKIHRRNTSKPTSTDKRFADIWQKSILAGTTAAVLLQ
jgi:hypothetical protein